MEVQEFAEGHCPDFWPDLDVHAASHSGVHIAEDGVVAVAGGDRIREERKQAGLAGISTSFLAYIETKGRKASLETVRELAEALRVPVARLFETAPGPGKDAIYAATRQFARLLRDRSAAETAGLLEVTQVLRQAPAPEIRGGAKL